MWRVSCASFSLLAACTSPSVAQPLAADGASRAVPSRLAPTDLRTRHATFRRASFDELPGWPQDDLSAGWPAFLRSCEALMRRAAWREICALATRVPSDPAAQRAFFEARFALLRILNTDASRDGDITGYFEPLLEGRRRVQGAFDLPVHGVPRDLYTLDWLTVPAALRQAIVPVKTQPGNQLVVLPTAEPGSLLLDLRQFALDTKDRRLRVRVSRGGAGVGNALRAEPYPARAALFTLGQQGAIDAPVLAWVADALALYALQIQGSGRIRLEDGSVLRVQYADQNGQPFKPLRVVAKGTDRGTTRALGGAAPGPDEFVLEDVPLEPTGLPGPAPEQPPPAPVGVVTRGLAAHTATEPARRASRQDAETQAVVDALLGQRPAPVGSRSKAAASPVEAPMAAPDAAPVAAVPAPATPGSASTQRPATARPAAGSTPAPAPTPVAAMPAAPTAASASARRAFIARLLAADPSYVFFKIATNQTSVDGPTGALGVPLTPGRSVAVDPRVTPLGYPVFLSAPAPQGSALDMQRLVFAQDTGGAIRGAVRADFFWGFGAEAGRLARGTRQRGEMWLLMPSAEAAVLKSGPGVVKRSIGAPAGADAGECLVADELFCQEPD